MIIYENILTFLWFHPLYFNFTVFCSSICTLISCTIRYKSLFIFRSYPERLRRMEEINSENRFKCHICPKTYSQKESLVRHEKTHYEEKSFECEICNKTFRRKDHLKRHQNLTHKRTLFYHKEKCGHPSTSQNIPALPRNFSCDNCGRIFSDHSNCKRHKKKCDAKKVSSLNSEFQFVNCGETIEQEIKEESETEDEINTLDFVKSEICEDIDESGEIYKKSELEGESIDCKETIKLEIKEEIPDTEDVQDPMFNTANDIEDESFVVETDDSL